MPQRKRPTKTSQPINAKKPLKQGHEEEDEALGGDSVYQRMKERFGEDRDGLYDWLRDHRHDDVSLCLGYYLMRAQREMNCNQAEVAERTRTKTEPPITRSFLSAILSGRSGIRADTWVRIAQALDANPLEFFLAEGWIDAGHVAAYQVSSSALLLQIAGKVDKIQPEMQPKVAAVVTAVLDAVVPACRDTRNN